jgi:hypothetical protein
MNPPGKPESVNVSPKHEAGPGATAKRSLAVLLHAWSPHCPTYGGTVPRAAPPVVDGLNSTSDSHDALYARQGVVAPTRNVMYAPMKKHIITSTNTTPM